VKRELVRMEDEGTILLLRRLAEKEGARCWVKSKSMKYPGGV